MAIKELRQKLDSGMISSSELFKYYAERIKKYDKDINSYITVCEKEAKIKSDISDSLIKEGKASLLTGIPYSVKDNICTKDIKTTCASKMLSDFVPFYSSTAYERLDSQTAVLLGKNNLDEFAMGSSNLNSCFGAVKNPYNFDCVSGGSSGGSAASVSAGLCVFSLGTDTGGSVRQPAAFCGVTGFKPSYGTISRYGLVAYASSLDQIGVIAKSAEDCAIVTNSLSGRDDKDLTLSVNAETDFTRLLGKGISGLKIGIPKEFFTDEVDVEVRNAIMDAAHFYEKKGCKLINISLEHLDSVPNVYQVIACVEASSNLAKFDSVKYGLRENGVSYADILASSRSKYLGNEVKKRIVFGNYILSDNKNYNEYYLKATAMRNKIRENYKKLFSVCDVIISPTAPTTAFSQNMSDNTFSSSLMADKCTVCENLAGLACVSTTCAYSKSGMPIGMQITGNTFCDALVLSVADVFEKEFQTKEAIV